MNRKIGILWVTACLLSALTYAQSWRGAETVGLQVSDAKGRPVVDARVTLTFLGIPGDLGPDIVATDAKGRAIVVSLAAGPWKVEVSHPEYLSYIAMVDVRRGKKPLVSASFLEAGGRSLAPIKVKVTKGDERQASPPLEARAPSIPPAAEAPVIAEVAPERPEPEVATATPEPEVTAPAPAAPVEVVEPEPAEAPAIAAPEPQREPATVEETEAEPPPLPETVPPQADAAEMSPAPEAEPEVVEPEAVVEPETGAEAAEPAVEPEPEPEVAEPAVEPEPEPQVAEPAVEPEPQPEVAPPAPTPAPKPEPATVQPPAVAAGAAAAPADPGLVITAESDGTCTDCQSAEWTAETSTAVPAAVAASGGACTVDVLTRAGLAMEGLADSIQLELAGFLGPAAAGTGSQAVDLAEPDVAAPFRGELASFFGGRSPCQIVGLVLPKEVRFSRAAWAAADQQGRGDCSPDGRCEVGDAAWIGRARMIRGRSATVVYGLFENRSSDRQRRAFLKAYFRPPNANWQPRTTGGN